MSQEIYATLCFALAIAHTFLVKWFQEKAHRYPQGSPGENLFHLLGEIEVVMGLWAGVFLLEFFLKDTFQNMLNYLEGLNFTEPAFVFVIMVICSTKPILHFANSGIEQISRVIPGKPGLRFFIATLMVGPILGSFITEPAAMTVTALILADRYFKRGISEKLKYATLGLLFVTISIGGTLTHFAAPPVLMVASKWGWDLPFMFGNFGWKAVVAIGLAVLWTVYRHRKELSSVQFSNHEGLKEKMPAWVVISHLLFLAVVIAVSHHMVIFIPVFLFFLGLVNVTGEYQSEVKLKEGLLVAFFLGGLVILGGLQKWWLEPLISSLGTVQLYLGAIGLTAITDNAALTYLGSQVPSLSEASKYALVAGSVVGGGLTVIANAPNPAGYGILNPHFGVDGISPLRLFRSALIPTFIAGLAFWLL